MKKYILPIISFIIALGCIVTYNIIGAKIAPDGTLIEPFFLIPISYLFGVASLVLAIIVKIKSNYSKAKAIN